MANSTDRLRLAPDDHSDKSQSTAPVGRSPEKDEGPAEVLRRQALERGRGRHTTTRKVPTRRRIAQPKGRANMRQSSRPPCRATSGPQRTAVNITPAPSAVPTTPTFTTA